MKKKTLLILSGTRPADSTIGDDRHGSIAEEQIRDACSALGRQLDISVEFRQTRDRDEMFRWIAEDSGRFDALIINPAGFDEAGTSDPDKLRSAIDVIVGLQKPLIEVHWTNVFRQGAEPAKPLQGPEGRTGFICGLGLHGYLLGIRAIAKRLQGQLS